MRRCPAVFAVLLQVTVAAVALPAQLRVVVDLPANVVFGQRFELSVLRAWPREYEAQPFDSAVFAPLELREVSVSMAVSGLEMIERRTFEAVAFEVGEVVFAPYTLHTRDATGQKRQANFTIDSLTVRSSLPDPPGDTEWAGDVRDAKGVLIWPLVLAALVLIGLVGMGLSRLRRPAGVVEAVPMGPSAVELARREIDALELPGADRARLDAYYLALAEIVRRFAVRQLGVRAFVHTSEELIAVVPVGGDPLKQCLFACDLVKFAANRPAQAADVDARARAMAFVEANAKGGNSEAVS